MDSTTDVFLTKDGLGPQGDNPPAYTAAGMLEQHYPTNNPHNYPPQQPQMAPTAPASPVVMPCPSSSNTVTAVNFAMPAGPVPVGPKSMQMKCHHCQAFIKTKTNSSAKSSAHIACCLLFIFTCGICSCIPYCMGSCKRVDHSCPNCNSFLGSYNG